MRPLRIIWLFLAILIFPVVMTAKDKPVVATKIKFYSTTLDLSYDPDMLKKNRHCTSTPCLKRFYTNLEKTNYQVLLDNLINHKEELQLNDWFFYNLVKKAVENIYDDKSEMYRTSITWFIMTKAGYDTRLYTSKSKYTFLYIRTEDKVFEAPFVKIKGQHYVNLTSVYLNIKTRGIYFEVPRYQPGQLNNKPFSFKLEHYPELPPEMIEKSLVFTVDNQEIVLDIDVDTIGNVLLKNFPITEPINYIKVPISNHTLTSLMTALKPHLEGKTEAEQISILVSLSRKAFPYKNDQIRFRRDQPLTADQLMMADSSDFEDRCALFYNLLKETTDLNFIVVSYIYDDIITIGVELPEPVGKPFTYQGINYTICDPTMPGNSSKLGIYPINLDKDIEILEIVNRGEGSEVKEEESGNRGE